jgi:hypothetical protein
MVTKSEYFDVHLVCLFCFNQENVGKREVDAADCKTVYLSEYVIICF